MRGLWKHLSPFAPDQSGAVSVLYELGGITVICDAGGCTGNICGFDEPRWQQMKSALFSAGLRDMDAIMGRDDRLVKKLADAAQTISAPFAAIVGTPVPAVIATDYRALRRLAEKKTGLPVLTVETTGTRLYDAGAAQAYRALVETFALEPAAVQPGRVGVFGLTPLDFGSAGAPEALRAALRARGQEAVIYDRGVGLPALRQAASAERNLAVSPAGLEAARLLEERFGTPWEADDPLAAALVPEEDFTGARVLVVHQQVRANAMRRALRARGAAEVRVASWFRLDPALAEPGDCHLAEEDALAPLAREADVLAADPMMRAAVPEFRGRFLPAPHFAVSGRWEP